ncbi:MAG: glycosyltransferase family 39 protein [Bacteroidetes bacterium]|nr:glycosyltransferase family 39 protein [Bacteroidota bacterium]
MKRRFQLSTYLFLIVISGLLFIPFIGTVHLFDWEEITYAEVAREMLLSGNWLKLQLNFQPFYEKPPLFVWMEALSMTYFGINDFAARLPNAICGIATVWVIYRLGKRLYNPYFGLTWALVFVGSFFPQFFFKTAVIDPWFNLFVFIGIYHLSRIIAVNQEPGELYRKSDTTKWLFYSAFFTALAVLTKGPIGLIIVFFTLMMTFVLSFARNGVGYINLVKWLFFVLMINGIWMAYLAYYHGTEYLQEFVYYQIRYLSTEAAVEADPWYFHFMMLFIGCYPASAFVFQGFKLQSYEPIYQSVMRRMMVACLIVIVIIFTILKSKVINYTSVAYFPITYLATYNIHRIFKGEINGLGSNTSY